MFFECIAPFAGENQVFGMIGAEALRRNFLAPDTLHVPQVFVQFVSRQRDDMVGLENGDLATVGVQMQLAHADVFLHQCGQNFFTRLIKLPPLDGRMTKIKIVGEFFLESFLIATGEEIEKELPIFGILKLHMPGKVFIRRKTQSSPPGDGLRHPPPFRMGPSQVLLNEELSTGKDLCHAGVTGLGFVIIT